MRRERSLSTTDPAARGRFIVLVGPDGVGKTTAAQAIVDGAPGRTAYFHFCPPVRGTLPEAPVPQAAPQAKKTSTGWQPLGWLRLARNVARAWLAYVGTIRPLLSSGTLVVGDRWMYGYVAQPTSLRYGGPAWLARQAVRIIPRPDLVANLVTDPATIRDRKPELTLEQITDELDHWSALPESRLRSFDAGATPDQVAAEILRST